LYHRRVDSRATKSRRGGKPEGGREEAEVGGTGSIASTCTTGSATQSRHWSPETIVLYQKRFEEGY